MRGWLMVDFGEKHRIGASSVYNVRWCCRNNGSEQEWGGERTRMVMGKFTVKLKFFLLLNGKSAALDEMRSTMNVGEFVFCVGVRMYWTTAMKEELKAILKKKNK